MREQRKEPQSVDVFRWSFDSVETVLRRRGHVIAATGDIRRTLFPGERLGLVFQAFVEAEGPERTEAVFGADAEGRYVELFGKDSFRKVIRKLIGARGHPEPLASLARVAGATADAYVEYLADLGVVERTAEGVRLTRELDNFGPCLEHYVAELCMRELRGDAAWGVKLKGLRAGGDYDVLAWLPPTLVSVECKSSPQSEVSNDQLRNFLRRAAELAPDLSVLLVDTDDDLAPLRDRLASLMTPPPCERWAHDATWQETPALGPQQGYPGVSFGYYRYHRIYLTHAEPSILEQLRRCLRHYHAQAKWFQPWRH